MEMLFRKEKEALAGHTAWARGQLERAVELLRASLAANPGAPEVLFPLARAYHEEGRSRAALEILDEALSPGAPPGAYLHRALVHYDLDDREGLRRDAELMGGGGNPVARALLELAAGRGAPPAAMELPPAALWNAEVVARYLALLEVHYLSGLELREDPFHHLLFTVEEVPPEAAAGAGERVRGAGEKERRRRSRWLRRTGGRARWLSLVHEHFARREFERLLRVFDLPGAPSRWREDLTARAQGLYALCATRGAAEAVACAARAAVEAPESVDFHFLQGLALARCGEAVGASHAFARAARLGDTAIHGVAGELRERLAGEAGPR